MASLASFSRMGARRLATVAARTAPRASMQVCNCCREEKPLQGWRPICIFEQEPLVCAVQGAGTSKARGGVQLFGISDEGRGNAACD